MLGYEMAEGHQERPARLAAAISALHALLRPRLSLSSTNINSNLTYDEFSTFVRENPAMKAYEEATKTATAVVELDKNIVENAAASLDSSNPDGNRKAIDVSQYDVEFVDDRVAEWEELRAAHSEGFVTALRAMEETGRVDSFHFPNTSIKVIFCS